MSLLRETYRDDGWLGVAVHVLLGIAMVVLAAALIALVVFGVSDCRKQSRCEDDGGHVERYNFRTEFIPVSCGKSCTVVVPTQVSDWHCVGATPEHSP